MSDELKKLANAPVEHRFGGRDFKLTPMKLLAALRAQEIVEPFVAELADAEVNVTRLMMRHSTRLLDLVVVMLAGVDPKAQQAEYAWLAGLDDDPEYETFFAKLVEVNNDFFARRVQSVALASLRAMVGPSKSPGEPTNLTEPSPPSDGLTP